MPLFNLSVDLSIWNKVLNKENRSRWWFQYTKLGLNECLLGLLDCFGSKKVNYFWIGIDTSDLANPKVTHLFLGESMRRFFNFINFKIIDGKWLGFQVRCACACTNVRFEWRTLGDLTVVLIRIQKGSFAAIEAAEK